MNVLVRLQQSFAAWIVLTAALAAAAARAPVVTAVALAGATAVAVWRWPEVSLGIAAFVVLAVRPSLDIFSERRFGLSEFVPNPAGVFGLGILGACFVFAIVRARDGRRLWPNQALLRPHLWLLGAYGIGLMSGGTLYGLAGAATGARELVRMASIVAAFLIILWWVEGNEQRYQRGWAYLIAGMLIPVATATWQWATGHGNLETEGLNRLQGTFSHSNSLGQYLAPFILFFVGGVPTSRGAGQFARIALALGLTVLVALTYSRTALFVLLAGLAVLPFLHARRFGWRGLVRGFVIVALTAGLAWWLAGGVIRQRFVNLSLGTAAWEAARSGTSENSFTWRLINWAGLVSLGLRHPFAGHGAGMTMVLNPLVSPANAVPFNAHNDFVRFFFEEGILGLACFLIYGVLLCGWVLGRARAAAPERAASAYAVAAAWLAMFFLTAGTPELSLQTAILYELYGMAALLNASQQAKNPA
jgi:O-antigen ligase